MGQAAGCIGVTGRFSNAPPQRERLWFAVRLPSLPLQALGFAPDGETPTAVVETRRLSTVICANHAAAATGVGFGTDAVRAQLLADCSLHPRDRAGEERELIQLADGLYRFSPHIEFYQCEAIAQSGLILEISSCLKLFSGFHALRSLVENYLGSTGYQYRLGLAHSARGAWLLSFSDAPLGDNRQTFIDRLQLLPIQLLHDFPKDVEVLERTGFVTLGDIVRQVESQTMSSLRKRLSRDFVQTISDIFAIEQDLQQRSLFQKPVAHYQPQVEYQEEVQFEYPVSNVEQLHYPVEILLQNLSEYLLKRQLECQQVEWMLRDIHGNSEIILVCSDTGQTDWRLLYDLTLIQLEARSLSFEVDRVRLRCPAMSPLQQRYQQLNFTRSRADKVGQHDFEIAIAKLKARLGEEAVYKVSYCDNHTPETMGEPVAVNAPANQVVPADLTTALRPIWLYAQPVRIEGRGRGLYARGYLQLLVGPERIHNDWWQSPRARDYYLASREDGCRLWVFQDLSDGGWYLHGMFA